MGNRREITGSDLEIVTGGKLRWQGGKVYPKDDPTHVYTFTDYE